MATKKVTISIQNQHYPENIEFLSYEYEDSVANATVKVSDIQAALAGNNSIISVVVV